MQEFDWEIIKSNALIALEQNSTFKSFRLEREYKIREVQKNRLFIDRISGGKTASFTKGQVLTAIETLKKNKRIPKGELIQSVVRESMLVYLHPYINWDSASNEVYWNENNLQTISLNSTIKYVDQASDDELEKVQVEINKRKSQSKFRLALLTLYDNKCAISNTGPNEVLKAAHIQPHSKNGINKNDNGILLRADFHDLFDNDLLLIHPKRLTIHFHPSLKLTYYSNYEGKKLAVRIDNSKPNIKNLQEKWENSDWAKSLL